MKLNLPLETQVVSYSNRKAFLALLTRIVNTHFQKESEQKIPIVINISTAISTAICIPLNFPQMSEFPEKTPVAFTHENKHLFSLPLPQNNASLQRE